ARQNNETKLAAAQLRAKASEKAAKGQSLTNKDFSGIIDSFDGSDAVGGKKLSKEAKAAVSISARNRVIANPDQDPRVTVVVSIESVIVFPPSTTELSAVRRLPRLKVAISRTWRRIQALNDRVIGGQGNASR
ncbi:hypothetical protein, partial [Pseudomonas tolaasii]|uniref:hypothetical protein n=1 Tax=Pseudomonas tolaasii TaxID=29442 RepID=UPI0018C8B650